MQLSFGEQVKIVLKRQGITIKELASRIEEQTGKKMSRQNLTQRLGRDNFQEKDMFMVADALGCSLTINLLEEEEAPAREEKVVTKPVQAEPSPEPAAEPAAAPEEKKSKFSPFGWYKSNRKRAEEEKPEEPAKEPVAEAYEETEEKPELTREELMKELNADIAALGDAGTVGLDDIPERGSFEADPENKHAFEREKQALLKAQAADREAELPAEELPSTSINPYTLREYKSNTVRAHASRIGYVQVYSRADHAWKDMTEWAFMGEQERRKALLGKQYEEPTYLD